MNVSEILDRSIRREYRHPRDGAGAYPTSASIRIGEDVHGSCGRELFYKNEVKTEGIETVPITADTLFIFKRGCMYEDLITDLFKQEGLVLGSNVKFTEVGTTKDGRELPISGEIDILLKDEVEDDVAWIVECKTYTNNYNSQKSLTTKGPFHNPKYLLQCMIYLDLFHKRCPYEIGGCILLYTDCAKPGPEKRFAFELDLDSDGNLLYNGDVYTDWNINAVYEKMMEDRSSIDIGELPEKDYDPDIKEELFGHYLDKGAIYKTGIQRWEQGKAPAVVHYGCSFCDFKEACAADKTLTEFLGDVEDDSIWEEDF
jgi:hypothetical protein